MLIADVHLDLAMNALEWNRDLTRPIAEIRAREGGMSDKPDRGRGTVSFEEMRRGGVRLCVATQIARYVAPGNPLPGWHSPEQAWAQTQGQLAWYRAMEDCGELVQVRDRETLDRQVRTAEQRETVADGNSPDPIGYILSLEGADSMVTLRHLERAYEYGLRAIGPAHYGPGVYANGTAACGDLGARGRELLREMERLGIILDVTHLCDDSFWDALDHYHGPLWASHSNARTLVPNDRQFSDDQLRALFERDAVIGAVFDAWMLVPGWVRGQTTPEAAGVTLDHVLNHIDYICQLAGSARHCMIGSDLDGAYGREQGPLDVETIADLRKIPERLAARGYSEEDVRGIAHGNVLRFLRSAWR